MEKFPVFLFINEKKINPHVFPTDSNLFSGISLVLQNSSEFLNIALNRFFE